jgi:hypothetical protein
MRFIGVVIVTALAGSVIVTAVRAVMHAVTAMPSAAASTAVAAAMLAEGRQGQEHGHRRQS